MNHYFATSITPWIFLGLVFSNYGVIYCCLTLPQNLATKCKNVYHLTISMGQKFWSGYRFCPRVSYETEVRELAWLVLKDWLPQWLPIQLAGPCCLLVRGLIFFLHDPSTGLLEWLPTCNCLLPKQIVQEGARWNLQGPLWLSLRSQTLLLFLYLIDNADSHNS